MKMELKACSETLAHKIQTPGNHPKERIQHSEHSKSLKSRTNKISHIKIAQKNVETDFVSPILHFP